MLKRVQMGSRSGRRLVEDVKIFEEQARYGIALRAWNGWFAFSANVIPKKIFSKECACCIWYKTR